MKAWNTDLQKCFDTLVRQLYRLLKGVSTQAAHETTFKFSVQYILGKRLEEVDAHYKLHRLSKICLHSSASCDLNFYQNYKPFFSTVHQRTLLQAYVIK